MITIDPFAGRHFDGKEIVVTTHAADQAKERFGVSWKKADDWIRVNLRKAQYMGENVSSDGKVTRLFGHNRICFVLDYERDVVVTVYERTKSPDYLRKAVEKAVKGEMAKMERRVNRKARAIERMKADLHREIGDRMAERQRTKSTAKKLALTAYINAMQAHFAILDGDYTEILREQSKLRKGVIAYV